MIKRRRECVQCKERYTTIDEAPEETSEILSAHQAGKIVRRSLVAARQMARANFGSIVPFYGQNAGEVPAQFAREGHVGISE
jgi:transcriptional regulator NrdR family protein